MTDQTIDRNARLRPLHLVSAVAVGSFLLLHLANHAALLLGSGTHRQTMETLRFVYRQPFVEALLMALLAWQVTSGLAMIVRNRRSRKGPVAWAQAISGALLAMFIVNHVAAVWLGRLWMGLDTDIRFAAAGMQAGFAGFFVPYYFLGLFALFVHVGCASWWRTRGAARTAIPLAIIAAGGLFAGAVVARMLQLPPIEDVYLASYR